MVGSFAWIEMGRTKTVSYLSCALPQLARVITHKGRREQRFAAEALFNARLKAERTLIGSYP